MRWTAGDGSAPVGAGPPRSIVAVEAIPPGKLATPRSGRCPESAGSGRGAGSGTVADATATDAPSSRSENRNSARVSATGIPARIAIRKRRRIIGRNTDHEDSKTLADSSGPCKIQNRASQAVPPRTTLLCLPGQCRDVPKAHGPLPRPPLHVSRERLRSVPHTLFTFVCRICVADRLFSDRGGATPRKTFPAKIVVTNHAQRQSKGHALHPSHAVWLPRRCPNADCNGCIARS